MIVNKNLFILLIFFHCNAFAQQTYQVELMFSDVGETIKNWNSNFSFEIYNLSKSGKINLYDFKSNKVIPKKFVDSIGEIFEIYDSLTKTSYGNTILPFFMGNFTKISFNFDSLNNQILILGREKNEENWDKYFSNKNYCYVRVAELYKKLSQDNSTLLNGYLALYLQLKEPIQLNLLTTYIEEFNIENSKKVIKNDLNKDVYYPLEKLPKNNSLNDSIIAMTDFKYPQSIIITFSFDQKLKFKIESTGYKYFCDRIIYQGMERPSANITITKEINLMPNLKAKDIFYRYFFNNILLNEKIRLIK